MQLQNYLTYLAAFLFVLSLIGLSAWAMKRFLLKEVSGFGIFSRNTRRRIEVVEAAGIDSRRRLLIVRCDNREHLLLVGGANDLVVESGARQDQRQDGDGGK